MAGTRSKAIQRHLRNVEAMPAAEARKILPGITGADTSGEEEEEEE